MVADFYESLKQGAAAGPEDAISVVEWTERAAVEADAAKEKFLERFPTELTATVLVTGATGFIGRHLLRRLLTQNQRVRIFTRREPPAEFMRDPRVEVVLGDLGDPEAVDRAVAGTKDSHVGAAMKGGVADFERGTVAGTRNIVQSALRHGVTKLVYVSSVGVLQTRRRLAGARRSPRPGRWNHRPKTG